MNIFASLVFIVLIAACGESSDRHEDIQKLRGLGASTLPLVSQPSLDGEPARTVELTLYAALPEGHTVDVGTFKDEESAIAITLEEEQIAIQTNSISYQSYPGFQVVSFKADLTVPPVSAFIPFDGAGQVRYGFVLRDGDEVEKVIGSFMVYPDGSPELAWQHPEVAIADPLAGSTLPLNTEADISALLTNTNDEELTVGWFASNGEIKNRRAKSSTWKTTASGAQTLLVTVHGKKSRGFSWQVVTVNAE